MAVRLTRRVTFSSGHRYWLPSLSPQENKSLFGPWASPYNHGHNYVLDVTVEGEVDPFNGMVVNIKWIDDILKDRILSEFDQKSINDEIPYFKDKSPSLENLMPYIASRLQDLPARLVALRLEETELFYGEWTPDTMTLTRTYEFAAAHRLHDPHISEAENQALFGKCNNPAGHGHNYIVEVTVTGKPDEQTGMMADLGTIDTIVEELVVDRYDHKNFNCDLPEFEGQNPTSEVIVLQIFKTLEGKLPAKLARVRLHENARNMFEVSAG